MAQAISGPYGTEGVTGSIGGLTLTQSQRGKTVLKKKPQPTNPQSASQMGNRHMFGFIGAAWAGIAALSQATFDALAASALTSAFAQYTKYNSDRWQVGKYPSQETPAGETAPAIVTASAVVTQSAGSPDQVTLSVTALATSWGVALFRKTGGAATGARSELIGVYALTPSSVNEFELTFSESSDQYGFVVFSDDGGNDAIEAAT